MSETAGPGAIRPNVRRVYKDIEGQLRHKVLVCREIDEPGRDQGRRPLLQRQRGGLEENTDSNFDTKIDVWATLRERAHVRRGDVDELDGAQASGKFTSTESSRASSAIATSTASLTFGRSIRTVTSNGWASTTTTTATSTAGIATKSSTPRKSKPPRLPPVGRMGAPHRLARPRTPGSKRFRAAHGLSPLRAYRTPPENPRPRRLRVAARRRATHRRDGRVRASMGRVVTGLGSRPIRTRTRSKSTGSGSSPRRRSTSSCTSRAAWSRR